MALSVSPTEQFLMACGVKYEKQTGGHFTVLGDLILSDRNLTKLPNLSLVTVEGDFSCSENELTSLDGSPKCVKGAFFCYRNKLTSLKGGPEYVGGTYRCDENELATLEGAPGNVGGSFNCGHNRLETLEGGPQTVQGTFNCSDNRLVTLKGAPPSVGVCFNCYNNRLTSLAGGPEHVKEMMAHKNPLASLEGAPLKFTCLDSDLGQFRSWGGVPEHLKLSDETRARMADAVIQSCTVLDRAMPVARPLIFRR